jgi:hypothetical protein
MHVGAHAALVLGTVQKVMPSVPLLKRLGRVEIITLVPLVLIDSDPVCL